MSRPHKDSEIPAVQIFCWYKLTLTKKARAPRLRPTDLRATALPPFHNLREDRTNSLPYRLTLIVTTLQQICCIQAPCLPETRLPYSHIYPAFPPNWPRTRSFSRSPQILPSHPYLLSSPLCLLSLLQAMSDASPQRAIPALPSNARWHFFAKKTPRYSVVIYLGGR